MRNHVYPNLELQLAHERACRVDLEDAVDKLQSLVNALTAKVRKLERCAKPKPAKAITSNGVLRMKDYK